MKHLHTHGVAACWLVVLLAAAGTAVMLLWNAVMPHLAGCPRVNYWEALALLVLCRILIGGFHPRNHGHHHARARLHERLRGMSREERQEFIRHHFHHCPGDDEFPSPPAGS
jgi:hypothetical protein